MRFFRDTLTFLATLVALGLIGLIVAPPFIDWGGQKARIAALIAARTGAVLVMEGEVRIAVLPTPELDADRVRIVFPGGLSVSADRLKVQLSPLSLLGLEQRVTRARLDRPVIRLGEALPDMPRGESAARKGGLDRLDLIGATLENRLGTSVSPGWTSALKRRISRDLTGLISASR